MISIGSFNSGDVVVVVVEVIVRESDELGLEEVASWMSDCPQVEFVQIRCRLGSERLVVGGREDEAVRDKIGVEWAEEASLGG